MRWIFTNCWSRTTQYVGRKGSMGQINQVGSTMWQIDQYHRSVPICCIWDTSTHKQSFLNT